RSCHRSGEPGSCAVSYITSGPPPDQLLGLKRRHSRDDRSWVYRERLMGDLIGGARAAGGINVPIGSPAGAVVVQNSRAWSATVESVSWARVSVRRGSRWR